MKIDKSICLTLDKRYDDYLGLVEQGKKHGFDIDCFLAGDGELIDQKYDHIDTDDMPPRYTESITYPTWWARPNAYNAWKCHKQMMEIAFEDYADTVVFFEDDSEFEEDFDEIWSEAQEFFEDNPWDMIYLGSYQNNTTTPTDNKYVYRTMGCAGFHAVIMKTNVIEALLTCFPLGPFDWMAGQFLHPTLNCYAVVPCIVSQKDGHSYVEGGHLSKPERDKL